MLRGAFHFTLPGCDDSFCAWPLSCVSRVRLASSCGLSQAALLAHVQWYCTNLVDPASSHMLVSKIKPCMSQYKLLYGETANGSLKQL